MPRSTASTLVLFALPLVLIGCGDDPAANVPKATVAPAKDAPPPDSAAPAPVAATATTPVPVPVPAGALAIKPATSKIEFVGGKKIGGSHPGGFKAFSGTVTLVEGKPEVKSIVVDIDTNSIFSDDEKLTGHLKNQDFFEVTKYPTAKFATTEIKAGGNKGASHTLVGNLTLHGVTKSITIPATLTLVGGVVTLKSEFALNKNDFGMTFGGPGNVIREQVVIKLDVRAEAGA